MAGNTSRGVSLPCASKGQSRLLQRNEAASLEALAAGCDLFAGHPITPAGVYYGRDREIGEAGNLVRVQTLHRKRRQNMGLAPLNEKLIKPAVLKECVC